MLRLMPGGASGSIGAATAAAPIDERDYASVAGELLDFLLPRARQHVDQARAVLIAGMRPIEADWRRAGRFGGARPGL